MQKCAVCGAPYNDTGLDVSRIYICHKCQREDLEYAKRRRAYITGKEYIAPAIVLEPVRKPTKPVAPAKARKYKHCARQRTKNSYTLEMARVIHGEYDQDQYISLLGCTAGKFIKHIESRFLPGMSWDNYNLKGWHIDHYIPYSYFDFSDGADMAICWNYHNLRPLWAKDNLDKSTSLPVDHLSMLNTLRQSIGVRMDMQK